MASPCRFLTITVKFCVALIMGVPLSETCTAMPLVIGDCAIVGRHEKIPLLELIRAPAGGASNCQVNVCAGRSGSLATFVTIKVWPASELKFPGALVKTGG